MVSKVANNVDENNESSGLPGWGIGVIGGVLVLFVFILIFFFLKTFLNF